MDSSEKCVDLLGRHIQQIHRGRQRNRTGHADIAVVASPQVIAETEKETGLLVLETRPRHFPLIQ